MQELIDFLLANLRGMWHRRWFGLATAWLAAIIGVAVVLRMPDKYEASARVYVDTQSLLQPLMAGMAITPDASQQVSILSRILLARPNVQKIIRKSDLDTSSGKAADSLVDETLGALSITRAGSGDNLYTISFRYPDGPKARDVVQAALSIFIEQSLGQSRLGTDSARRFLDAQIKDYEKRLSDAEARMQQFQLKNMAVLGTHGRDYLSQMGTITDEIKDARIELRVAEQTRDGLKKQLADQLQSGGAQAGSPAPPPQIAVPELDGRIDTLKRALDELLRRYTDLHPDVVAIKRQIAELEDQRKQEVAARLKAMAGQGEAPTDSDPVAQQLKVALNEAESNLTAIRARLVEYENTYNRLKSSAESIPKIETELKQLNRDYDIQKRQYDSLVARRETANLTGKLEDAGVAEFRVIDPPRVSPRPVAPNRLLLLGGVVAGSLLAGLGASWVVSQIRPTFHDGRTLRQTTNMPILGLVSMLPNASQRHRQRRQAYLFAGGMSGLIASYAAAFFLTLLATRGF